MTASLYSPSWHRVARLKPRLRAQAEMHRQVFRGEVWYILQDHQTGRFHRLSPAARHATCLMDGRRDVEAIWTILSERLGEDQPTQEELVRLLSRLHAADLLAGEIPPLQDEITHRADRLARREMLTRIRNPLALRLPLWDPDRFLAATLPLVRPVFTVWGFVAWLALVATGAALAVLHWEPLASSLFETAFAAENLVLALAVYPAVKAVHELGHAWATKAWGGEVHETGVMLLVLMPVPYVDASAATAFREKWRRMIVGGAGIMVELALASAALIVWISVEPGLVRAIAFNVALIGGVSTLLFNGNPLLRFDGYYVFCDLIEIPNLGTRANKYVGWLVERRVFGVEDAESPVTGRGEAPWLFAYAVAAFVYRMAIMVAIALFVATQFFIVGVALAVLAVTTSVVWPIAKGLWHLVASPRLARVRGRAIATTGAAAGAFGALVLAVPLPHATVAQGVVWVGEDSVLRTPADAAVVRLESRNGAEILAGDPVALLDDPLLAARVEVLERQRDELVLRLEAVRLVDRVQASILAAQIEAVEGSLAVGRETLASLALAAPKAGRLLLPEEADLPGRMLARGTVVGYLVAPGDPIVSAVVPQTRIDLVRERTLSVAARLVDRPDDPLAAVVRRYVPAALAALPHPALATAGGGPVLVDPTAAEALRPLETWFQIEIEAPVGLDPALLGKRVHVRFAHPPEPLATRWARDLRQLFLSRFGV